MGYWKIIDLENSGSTAQKRTACSVSQGIQHNDLHHGWHRWKPDPVWPVWPVWPVCPFLFTSKSPSATSQKTEAGVERSRKLGISIDIPTCWTGQRARALPINGLFLTVGAADQLKSRRMSGRFVLCSDPQRRRWSWIRESLGYANGGDTSWCHRLIERRMPSAEALTRSEGCM